MYSCICSIHLRLLYRVADAVVVAENYLKFRRCELLTLPPFSLWIAILWWLRARFLSVVLEEAVASRVPPLTWFGALFAPRLSCLGACAFAFPVLGLVLASRMIPSFMIPMIPFAPCMEFISAKPGQTDPLGVPDSFLNTICVSSFLSSPCKYAFQCYLSLCGLTCWTYLYPTTALLLLLGYNRPGRKAVWCVII